MNKKIAAKKKVPVDIWAKQYENSKPIADAEVTDIKTGERWKTDEKGYVHCQVEPGRTLTLVFNKAGFPPKQTGSVTVPAEGLTGHDKEITLQVPGMWLYKLLMAAFGKPKENGHHVVVTVSAEGKNLHDDCGEEGAIVTLRSVDGKVCREDGIYLGNILGKTEWLRPILSARVPFLKALRHKSTSPDGGMAFLNVPPGDYIIEARKTGADGKEIKFTTSKLTIFENSPPCINISPPQGPKVISQQPEKTASKQRKPK